MELYWYIVVIIFIIVKIFFYICWYRSRQRQLHAYLSNPRNAQIVIVGGRAYLQQICERQRDLVWSNWYGVQDDVSVGEPSGTLPPAPSYSQLEEVPPPYEAVPREDLKPPPYSELSPAGSSPEVQILNIPENYDAYSLTDAPPPYTPSPSAEPVQEGNAAPPYSQAVGQSETADAQKTV